MAKRLLLLLPFFYFFLFLSTTGLFAQAPVSQTYTADGTWTCPIGVTSVTVQCWGAGGGGGGTPNSTGRSGGGGGGGAFASNNAVPVTPGTTYNITVGTGGGGGSGSNDGANGENTSFAAAVIAAGGSGGRYANGNGAGGAGGTVAASTGVTVYAGGNGVTGSGNVYGGGGGGGAGTLGPGLTGLTLTAGLGGAAGGGAGGNGSSTSGGDGANGNVYGGGGGGTRRNGDGGNGANGRAIITYIIPNETCATAIGLTSGTSCVTAYANSSLATGSGAACAIGNADDDLWFSFVAVATTHTVTVNGAANYDGVLGAWNSCGGTQPTGGTCVNATGADGNETLTLTGLTIGNTYYIETHDNAAGGGEFTICVTHSLPPACAENLTVSVGCAATVLSWAAPLVTASNSAATSYLLYYGTDDPPTNIINGTNIGNVLTYTPTVAPGTTYYWQIVPVNSAGSASGCSGELFAQPTSTTPSNDLPCNAAPVTLGSIATGNNSCSGSTGEPGNPGCWDGNTRNTVWFSFVAPASGSVKIRTAPTSLASTQIALYSGTCGAAMTLVTCNDNAPACGSTPMAISEISQTGLTAGATYYVAVDGNGTNVGTFAITVIEGSASYPSSSGQACSTNIAVCNSTISIGNPGYQGVGFTCDFGNGGNCTTGERGSSWYTINIATSGTLTFNIVPNNYNGTNCTGESDYDFILWKISGTGATSCSAITAGNGAGAIRCNYDAEGVTGLSTSGNATTNGYPACFDGAYETGVAVVAGEVYLLVVQNFSGSTSGYTLDLSSVAAGTINYTPPTAITWTGGSNTTTWTNTVNWGGCTQPSCTIDGTISPSSSFQPNITAAMGTVTVKNLTIDPGSTLTLSANSVLKICGDFTNNGTITASATSTILFSDDATHTMSGNFTGSNKLGNLTITDVAGGGNCTVTTNSAVEIGGSFTTTNATSIFNTNGQNITVGRNFNNAAAGATFANATGTLTFNGGVAQTYNPGGALTLNNVVMNHTGPGVTIATAGTPDMILGTTGVLTLTAGKIITPGTQAVRVTNTANAAVSNGSTISFVQGNLRRSLASGALGIFSFPVGHSTKGYQRIVIDFKTAASASPSELLARFDEWGGAWTMPAAPNWGPECNTFYDRPFLDNGYWSVDVVAGTSTGSYDMTLYNTNYTNAATGFTISKSPSASPAWTLNGTCITAPVTAVLRNGMSGFSKFATVQSSFPLPVELTTFTGVARGTFNELKWESAQEENFDRYELESSPDAFVYTRIHTRPGSSSNSNALLSYTFDDYTPYLPVTYYRLKMIDDDGTYKYSPVISVVNEAKQDNTVLLFPNPATDEVHVQFAFSEPKEVLIAVKDVQGRVLMEGFYTISPDKPVIILNTSSLSAGTYIISCKGKAVLELNNKLIISK